MQTVDIEIPGNVLKALSIFAAAKIDPRHFLQGVYVHLQNHKIVGVATDGKILGLSRSLFSNLANGEGVFIPTMMISSLLKGGGGKWLKGSVFIKSEGSLVPGMEYKLTLSLGGQAVSSYVRGVTYAQYQNILPRSFTRVYGAYDPNLLLRLQDAFTLATGQVLLPLIGNGVNGAAAAYDVDSKWFSLVMPLSNKLGDEQPDTLPEMFLF